MYFHEGSKNLNIQKMIYYHFFNFSKIKIFCLLVYGGIIMKMDDSHLVEKVLKFLFHAKEAMGNESTNNMVFFLTFTCVLILLCIL
jgi:hypothetical protein